VAYLEGVSSRAVLIPFGVLGQCARCADGASRHSSRRGGFSCRLWAL